MPFASILVVAVAVALGAGLVFGDQRRLAKSRDTVRVEIARAADLQQRLDGARVRTAEEKERADGLQTCLDETTERTAAEARRADDLQKRLDQLKQRLDEATERAAAEKARADQLDRRLSSPLAPPIEKYLHEGTFAAGEAAALVRLNAEPADDETRFGLGMIQFARAVENLGRALYKHGAVSEMAVQPFLRLPVPKNDDPKPISYKELGRILDAFAADLWRAEATLAAIKDDKVKLRLRLANVSFDFAGTGKERTTLIDLLNRVNEGRFEFQKDNPELRVHFDRGDVAWLRAYCHLLSAMVDGYRALDMEAGFHARVGDVFPKVERPAKVADDEWFNKLKVVEPNRLRSMRLHFVAVCELNRETWKHIRAETDNDHEWLPHPKQTDQLGIPMSDQQIDRWLDMMAQFEGLLKGERLFPRDIIALVQAAGIANMKVRGSGDLNLKKYLDDPPADALDFAPQHFEAANGRPLFDVDAVMTVLRLFNGPFGRPQAFRIN